MVASLFFVLSTMAAIQERPVMPADIDRCIDDNAKKLGRSSKSAPAIADRIIRNCDGLIEQWTAARDAVVAKEAGPVPPSNSAEFRISATDDFRQSAIRSVERVRQNR